MRLSYLYYEITRECNHRCVQCFNNSRYALPGELSTAAACALIEAFRDQGGKRLQLTGGDPLVRRDLRVLLDAAQACDFERVILSTNGLKLDERCADGLVGKIDEINLSLDGFKAEHDLLRGVHCWEQSVRAIKLSVERGFHTFVCCCLSPATLERIDEFLDFLVELGVNNVKIAQIGNVGRRQTPASFEIPSSRSAELFDRLQIASLRVRPKLPVWQSLTRSVVPPSVERDGLVSDPTGALFPLIGYLPPEWQVGRASPDWFLDHERMSAYERVVKMALEKGISKIASGEPVNWWTIMHDALERSVGQMGGD